MAFLDNKAISETETLKAQMLNFFCCFYFFDFCGSDGVKKLTETMKVFIRKKNFSRGYLGDRNRLFQNKDEDVGNLKTKYDALKVYYSQMLRNVKNQDQQIKFRNFLHFFNNIRVRSDLFIFRLEV